MARAPRSRILPAGAAATWAGTDPARCHGWQRGLHGEAAPLIQREALLRVAEQTLALGARDAADLPNEPRSLNFLARALVAALAR